MKSQMTFQVIVILKIYIAEWYQNGKNKTPLSLYKKTEIMICIAVQKITNALIAPLEAYRIWPLLK